MLAHPENMPLVDRNFEAMLVWMYEEPMDITKAYFIKQTTNTSRSRIDNIKYKVDVNTMEHSYVESLSLNEIACVAITTAKELFFDPYKKNKSCGAFILIDPVTNNTSAVGMIVDRIEAKDLSLQESMLTLNLSQLGIEPVHYDAVEKVVKELAKQGIGINIIR